VISHGGHYAGVHEAILLKVTVPDADPCNESARVEGNRLKPAMRSESLNSVLFQEMEAFFFNVHYDSTVFVFASPNPHDL
jgi:hypothetical protein